MERNENKEVGEEMNERKRETDRMERNENKEADEIDE